MTTIDRTTQCVEAYRKTKNLKLVGADLGIPWQSVYVYLRKAGEPVIGDKQKYGSETDKLASKAEAIFQEMVPFAIDQNRKKFQSKIDFQVGDYGVDVKASRLRPYSQNRDLRRWAFSVKKQEAIADFFVCLCFDEANEKVERALLIPGEIGRMFTTISLAHRGGKWADYYIELDQIRPFFESLQAA